MINNHIRKLGLSILLSVLWFMGMEQIIIFRTGLFYGVVVMVVKFFFSDIAAVFRFVLYKKYTTIA